MESGFDLAEEVVPVDGSRHLVLDFGQLELAPVAGQLEERHLRRVSLQLVRQVGDDRRLRPDLRLQRLVFDFQSIHLLVRLLNDGLQLGLRPLLGLGELPQKLGLLFLQLFAGRRHRNGLLFARVPELFHFRLELLVLGLRGLGLVLQLPVFHFQFHQLVPEHVCNEKSRLVFR